MKAFPRDVEVATMKIRHVGIENELAVGENFDGAVTEKVATALRKHGIFQDVGYDGGGREFKTRPISTKSLKQVRGFKYVCDYFDTLKENTRPISSGGTHIHISILNNDHVNMEGNATAMAMAFFRQFQKIAGRETTWAYKLHFRTLAEVFQRLDANKCKVPGANTRTYNRMGSMLNPTGWQTLEFRGPTGSNDKDEILAWIEFLENIVKVANRKSVEGVQFKTLLKGERISAYVNGLTDWRKLTKSELEATFNGARLQ
jgi:hypothetical protein